MFFYEYWLSEMDLQTKLSGTAHGSFPDCIQTIFLCQFLTSNMSGVEWLVSTTTVFTKTYYSFLVHAQ